MGIGDLTLAQKFGIKLVLSVGFFALLGVCSGAMVLWYSESWAATDAQRAYEGRQALVRADFAELSQENEGRLVHVAGMAEVAEPVRDPDFLIAEPVVRLQRLVLMYQWVEWRDRSASASEPEHQYAPQWEDRVVDSTQFSSPDGHQNPNYMPWQTREWANPSLTFGAYRLGPAQLQLLGTHLRPLQPMDFEALPAEVKDVSQLRDGELYFPVDRWLGITPPGRVNPDFTPAGPRTEPSIGDVQIRFNLVRPGPVTIVAKQTGKSFAPYPTSAGEIEVARIVGELKGSDSM